LSFSLNTFYISDAFPSIVLSAITTPHSVSKLPPVTFYNSSSCYVAAYLFTIAFKLFILNIKILEIPCTFFKL
jgi:hypothetical protein